jgi:hypothetical protein
VRRQHALEKQAAERRVGIGVFGGLGRHPPNIRSGQGFGKAVRGRS